MVDLLSYIVVHTMLKPPLQGILFDFDGLILDTETPIFQAWQEMYRKYGEELILADWAEILGKSVEEMEPLKDFFRDLDSDNDQQAILEQISRREIELVGKQRSLPGVTELIQKARESGLKLGIVSSSDLKWVRTHLQRLRLEKFFDDVSCADEVPKAKPDPALYHLGLKKMNLTPEKVVVLEDSPNGILSAKRAGLYCIAVPNQITRQLPYYKNGGAPDLILDSLHSFPWDELMKD